MEIVINTKPTKRKPVVRQRKRGRSAVFVWAVIFAYLSSVAVAAVVSEFLVRQIYGYSLLEVLFGNKT